MSILTAPPAFPSSDVRPANVPNTVNAPTNLVSTSDEHIPETFKMFAPAVAIAVGSLLTVPVRKSPILTFILGVVVQILNTALAV